jgi:hypothetical protein
MSALISLYAAHGSSIQRCFRERSTAPSRWVNAKRIQDGEDITAAQRT